MDEFSVSSSSISHACFKYTGKLTCIAKEWILYPFFFGNFQPLRIYLFFRTTWHGNRVMQCGAGRGKNEMQKETSQPPSDTELLFEIRFRWGCGKRSIFILNFVFDLCMNFTFDPRHIIQKCTMAWLYFNIREIAVRK